MLYYLVVVYEIIYFLWWNIGGRGKWDRDFSLYMKLFVFLSEGRRRGLFFFLLYSGGGEDEECARVVGIWFLLCFCYNLIFFLLFVLRWEASPTPAVVWVGGGEGDVFFLYILLIPLIVGIIFNLSVFEWWGWFIYISLLYNYIRRWFLDFRRI